MKKALFILPAFAALSIACNDDDNSYNYPSAGAFVTARTIDTTPTTGEESGESDFYFELDNGKTMSVVPNSVSDVYEVTDEARSVIFFDFEEPVVEGYDYTILMRSFRDVIVGEVTTITTEQEDQDTPDNTLSFVNVDISLANDWLNLYVGYISEDADAAQFRLVKNDYTEPDETVDGYLNLELRFERGGSDSIAPSYEDYVSFDVSSLSSELEGKEGILLKIITLRSGETFVKVNKAEAERVSSQSIKLSKSI